MRMNGLPLHFFRAQSFLPKLKHRLLLYLLIGTLPVSAQVQTLSQVLDRSVKQFPFLKSKQSEIESAQQRKSAALTERLPILTVQHQYNYATNNSITGSVFNTEGTNVAISGGVRPENNYEGVFGSFTTAVAEWRLINFGRVKASIRAADAEVTRAQEDYQNEIFQHQIRVSDAYLVLLINQKLVEIQRRNLDRAITFKQIVDSGVRSGMRPGVDSSLATAEASRARMLLLESQQREQVQRLQLSELTGLVEDHLQIDSLRFYTSLPASPSASDSLFLNHPALRFQRSQVDWATARSIATHRSLWPTISLVGAGWARGSGVQNNGDVYRTDLSNGIKYQVGNYLFGVSARWNLTNALRIKREYRGDVAQTERFQHLYQEQNNRLQRLTRESETQFNVAMEQARQAPVQLQAARQAYHQAQARYKNGLADLPTVLQSFLTLNRAEVDAYVANSNAWRSLLRIAAAEGDLSLFLNQVK